MILQEKCHNRQDSSVNLYTIEGQSVKIWLLHIGVAAFLVMERSRQGAEAWVF